MTEPAAAAVAPPPYPRRFGWGMRLFLAVFLFDMIFRSFSVLWPTPEWGEQLGMRLAPARLPTRAEIAADPAAARADALRALDSLWEFARPWPEPGVRENLHAPADAGRWLLCWLTSRLEFTENLVGINQEWPMFSPSVGKQKWVARARLVYADGSTRIVRGLCDPEDLRCYAHWFQEKILDHELKVKEGRGHADDSFGYCNLLRHRYPHGDRGAELAKIYLFVVRYDFPPPRVDARLWLGEQTGPPAKQVYADFYVFDAKSNHGQCLLDRYD